MMEEYLKAYFVCLSYPIRNKMNTSNSSVGLGGEANTSNKQIKKLSILLNDSDSDDDYISNQTIIDKTTNENLQMVEHFDGFNNKFLNKDAAYRLKKLKLFREDDQMQSLAKAVFDFSMDDDKKI